MNTRSISNWIVNACGERCDVRDAICFAPICRLLHLKPSGNRICPRMIDIHLPTTDGRHIVMSRHTQPGKDVSLLLAQTLAS
ncbi:MAG: hypothetical protein NUV74_16990 [Candidatus Brocadiaceae bacterium]|nr:hypothetical protein [Candidatus Brocadiaceae bacterium]